MATSNKVIAIALLVTGAGLAVWGYQLSDSLGSMLNKAVTGSDTDKVMGLYIAGAVLSVIGVYLFNKK
tara:strand:- start:102 stop:305 length:204 start_codon:yes stop_codon:yes gene_type:complete